MPASRAIIATGSASRYLQQLCKHWSHKFSVEFTSEQGMIPFDATRVCRLEASPERLSLRIEAADDATLERTQGVVIDHLKRFAFREELGEVQWERAGSEFSASFETSPAGPSQDEVGGGGPSG